MMRIVMVSLVAAAVLTISTPRSIAGELGSELPQPDSTCGCTVRHLAMIEARNFRKVLEAKQLAEEAARLEAEAAENSEDAAGAAATTETDDDQSGG